MLFMGTSGMDPNPLRKFRKRLGQTQEELADRLGIKRPTYAKYETGMSNPPSEVMDELRRLGYDPDKDPDEYNAPYRSINPSHLELMIETLADKNASDAVREMARIELRKALGLRI